MPVRSWAWVGVALLGGVGLGPLLAAGCGPSSAPSPFELFDPGAGAAGAAGQGGSAADAGDDADDSILGGPCDTDEQCNDQLDCTFDPCDHELGRCRFVPDDSSCQNSLFCDGVERCDPKLGCVLGEPVTCSDGNPCTIDTCEELTGSCLTIPRDVDGDGDADAHCTGGHDCDDQDPEVSSLAPERCSNGIDDDCDGQTDEADCVSPSHDDCLDPLELSAPGVYPLSTVAASLDYAASCGVSSPATARDVVAAILLPAGPLQDVQLTARTPASPSADVALALFGQCDDAQTEIACSPGFAAPGGGRIAKLRGRSLGNPADALALPAMLFTSQGSDATLRFELLPASTAPANETCGTAVELLPSSPVVASVIGVAADVASACAPATGDLVYQITLATASDVDLYASSVDGDGWPAISLRSQSCALPEDEIACQLGASAHVYRHSLPAGSYFVAVAASAPTDVLLTLELSPPTLPSADDDCVAPPPLEPGHTIDVIFDGYQDDVNTGCLAGAVDAAYALELSEPSDVLVVGRFSSGDQAAVELELPACATPDDQLACGLASISPLRAAKHAVPAGSYRVLAESQHAAPMQLTALVRPAVPTTLVPFADSCADVLAIPSTGGFFQGNTANASANYVAGCDQGGQPPGGAREQLLKLELAVPKRVVLDMQGSGYNTLLDVRRGPSCPGDEVPNACAAGYYPERSFLDLQLEAGTYFLQIDGYASAYGPWFLDVRVVDP
jgi:hypothetical protein